MEKRLNLIVVLMSLILAFTGGCSSDSTPPPSSSQSSLLTVTTSIRTSAAGESLAVVDPPNEIILTFSESLDVKTAQENVNLHIFKADGTVVPVTPPVEVKVDAKNPAQVIIRTMDGSRLSGGEAYKLVAGAGIKASSGAAMQQEYTRYFVTNHDHFLLQGTRETSDNLDIEELDKAMSSIIVISDIHLGDKRSMTVDYDGKYSNYGWFNKNGDRLAGFLTILRQRPYVKELVIAGDLFDEWVAPMDVTPFGEKKLQSEFLDTIVAANSKVIAAFNEIIKEGKIRVTYVPGNHDMLVTSADIKRVFPGINEARDAQGLGAYTPEDRTDLVVEHGHRYDFFNAPDPISNRSITGTDSILPPGFFVTKIASTSDQEKNQSKKGSLALSAQDEGKEYLFKSSYLVAWELVIRGKPVKAGLSEKIIKTGVDGYSASYAMNDLLPNLLTLKSVLYNDIMDSWKQRQTINKVPVHIFAESAMLGVSWLPLELLSSVQYFNNSDSKKRIVIFGHSHDAGVFPYKYNDRWTIYGNSGTWVDDNKNKPTCTFVAIGQKKENGAVTDTVTVYQYLDSNKFNRIKSATINN